MRSSSPPPRRVERDHYRFLRREAHAAGRAADLIAGRGISPALSGVRAGARLIPLGSLRDRMDELPDDRPIWVYCQVGQRAYYASRALRLNGYDARNLTGGYRTLREIEPAPGD